MLSTLLHYLTSALFDLFMVVVVTILILLFPSLGEAPRLRARRRRGAR